MRVAGLAVVYGALAYLGLQWATALDAASPIWPASGVALAAVLVWGRRVWPGVALGALAAMTLSEARTPFVVEIAIALGNSAAPVLVASGLRRLKFDRELQRPRDVVLLVGGGLAYGLIAGLCGVASLVVFGGLPAEAAGLVLFTWATGDAAGVMTAGVLALAWARREPVSRSPRWWAHFAGAVGTTALAGWWLFFAGGAKPPMASWQLLPFLVWAALALDLRATATATSLAVGLALAGVMGGQPFPDGAEEALLTAVQRFTAVCTVTLALLAVLIETERRARQALAERDLYRRALETEAGLRRSEEVLRLALEGADMDAFEWDRDTDRCIRSRDGLAFLGVDIGSTGAAFLARVHPEDRPAVEAAFLELAPDSPSATYDYRFRVDDERHVRLRDTVKGEFDASGRLVRVRGVCADVSQRVAAQQALREQEAFTNNLIEAAPTLTYVWDAENDRNRYASPQTSAILGYTPEEVREMGSAFLPTLVHPDDAPKVFARYEELLASNDDGVYDLEYRMRHKNGDWVWLYSRDRVSRRNKDGKPVEFLGVALEITKRKQAEDAVRVSLERLQAAEQAIGALVYDVGEGGTWRSGVEGLLGWPAEAIGADAESWRRLIHPDDLAKVWSASETDTSLGRYAVEYRVKHKDGRWIWVMDRGQKVRDENGKIVRLIGASFDVTERVEAEREARESAARLDLAQSVTRIGTWDWTISGNGAIVSRTWREIFGLNSAETGPVTYEDWLACVHPDDRERASADVRARLEDPSGDELRSEYRCLTADGEVRWIEARGRLYRDADGVPVRLIGVVVDVSERRLSEERQTLLMREVDHRAKNALAVVQAVVRLTKAKDKEVFVKAVEGRIQAIARAQTLLSSTRWAGADLRRLVEEEAAPFQSGDGGRVSAVGPKVLLEPDAAQPAALALHELFTNAAKYGALSVPEGKVRIEWSVDAGAGVLRLAWRERGGPPTVEPQAKGFGSTVIRSAVESQLRGTLRKTWSSAGLDCDIAIPLSEISETILSRPSLRAVDEDAPPRRRALVVEDEVFIGLDVCEALDALGYEALGPVGRVSEALDLIAAVRPDVAILDANLAGESSEPVARRLAELRVPFVLCTGYGDFSIPELTVPVLQKPLAAEELGAALKAVLEDGAVLRGAA